MLMTLQNASHGTVSFSNSSECSSYSVKLLDKVCVELLRIKVITTPAYLGNLSKCRVILFNTCNICLAASEGRGEEHYGREIHYHSTQQSVEHSVKPLIRYTARNVVIF